MPKRIVSESPVQREWRNSNRNIRIALIAVISALLALGVVYYTNANAQPEPPEPTSTVSQQHNDTPSQTDASPEQQLADRYAPITYLRQVNNDICNTDNEGFDPVAVDFVLGRSEIPLMDTATGLPTGPRRTIKESPLAADLYGQEQPYFLDFPGSPVRPRCDYRRDFANWAAAEGVENVAYAHIYLEPDTDELALQYWFFYYFNDWNNQHEGDWEMVMLFFDATTVEEALTQEPTRVVYAQHGGGERADWDDEKFSKEDGRPVVYVARGAHASFFEQYTYLGLAENGTGFGCETTKGPHRRIETTAVVVPHEPTGPDDEFAWLAFTGRWGEFRRSEWNGPTGPNDKTSWTQPVSWGDRVRDSSLVVPEFEGLGQSPINIFCGIVGGGSRALVAFTQAPTIGVVVLITIIAAIAWVVSATNDAVRDAFNYYRRHWRIFGPIGVVLIVVGELVAIAQTLIFTVPPIEPFVGMMQRFPGVRLLLIVALGSAQVVMAALFVAPAVIWAMSQIRKGRIPTITDSYRNGVRYILTILIARFRIAIRVILLSATIVGIPRAFRMLIRAAFIGQAAVHDDDSPLEAVRDSERAANISLRKVLLTQVVLSVITAFTGPLVTIIMLAAIPSRPLDLINFVSSVIFALLYPVMVIGMTLLYFTFHPSEDRTPEVAPDTPPLVPIPDPAGA